MLIGHEKIWNFLLQSAAKNRLAHAYLFIGAQGVGKKTVALEFVKNLLCENKSGGGRIEHGVCKNCRRIEQNQHPDVLFLNSGDNIKDKLINTDNAERNSEIKIEQIRQLQRQISLSPFCAPRKVIIIDEADRMSLEAANCLLKTLEEPPQKSLLILISSNSQRILPTIVSRCQLIKFLPVKNSLIEAGLRSIIYSDKEKFGQAAKLSLAKTRLIGAVKFSCGRPGFAINLIKDPSFWVRQERQFSDLERMQKSDLVDKFKYAQKLSQDISNTQEILNDWLVWFRDRILEKAGLKNLIVFSLKSASQDSSAKSMAAIKNILETKHLLSEDSFNHRLVLENLLMNI